MRRKNFIANIDISFCKYISLLKFYYYGDSNAREYLEVMGFNTQTEIYTNYDTKAKRDEKTQNKEYL